MALSIVVLGRIPSSLPEQLAQLSSVLDVEVTGFHADIVSAREALAAKPDIAFISASVGTESGFDFLRSVRADERPASVVFSSDREEDAVLAFELQATDFVPMPVSEERLLEALTRARQQVLQLALLRTADELQRLIGQAGAAGTRDLGAIFSRVTAGVASGAATFSAAVTPAGSDERRTRSVTTPQTGTFVPSAPWRSSRTENPVPVRFGRGDAEEAVLDLAQQDGGMDQVGQSSTRPLRVLVREGRRTRFVPLADVDWFEADGNYILVHAAGERYRTRGTITAIESALDPRQFVRIHRRMVVNMDRVREMSPLPGGDGLLLLGDGATLRLSRTYRARVK